MHSLDPKHPSGCAHPSPLFVGAGLLDRPLCRTNEASHQQGSGFSTFLNDCKYWEVQAVQLIPWHLKEP